MKIAVFALLFALPVCQAATPKENYELQERCGKRAEDWFKKVWGDGVARGIAGMASYRNHYSPANNKCFVLLTYSSYSEKTRRASSHYTLFDVNESKDYGSMLKFDDASAPTTCRVTLKRCNSEAEWDALIAPFMGD